MRKEDLKPLLDEKGSLKVEHVRCCESRSITQHEVRIKELEKLMREMDKRMENIFDRQRDLAIMMLREVKDMFEKNLTK